MRENLISEETVPKTRDPRVERRRRREEERNK